MLRQGAGHPVHSSGESYSWLACIPAPFDWMMFVLQLGRVMLVLILSMLQAGI